MPEGCYVIGCKSGQHGAPQAHIFKSSTRLSDDMKAEWLRNIPKRVNKPFEFGKSHICHLHFEEDFIQKNDFWIIDGKQVPTGNRPRWTLKPNAVPTKFSNQTLPKYYDRKPPRKSPKTRKPLPKVPQRERSKNKDTFEPKNVEVKVAEEPTLPTLPLNPKRIKLPNNLWGAKKHRENGVVTDVVCFKLVKELNGFVAQKIISYNQLGEVKASAYGRNVSHLFRPNLSSVDDFNSLISRFDRMNQNYVFV